MNELVRQLHNSRLKADLDAIENIASLAKQVLVDQQQEVGQSEFLYLQLILRLKKLGCFG